MKKLLLLITIIYLGTVVVYAQSLQLMNRNGQTVNNGDTITYTSTDVNATFVSYIWVKNTTSNTVGVRVKKVELDTVPGTENYFCWDNCYQPNIYVSGKVSIAAGQTNKTNFSGDYSALGHAGKTRIMYVFFDDANPTDSVAYIAEYYAGSGTGYSMGQKIRANVKVYPNPATNFITIDYNIPGTSSDTYFELRNILGSVVKSIKLNNASGHHKTDISKLQSGIYFYTIRVDNQTVISEKLIVK